MKKIHYVYKIINLKNKKEYIGVRTSPNPKNDNYMGSSKIMENLYKLEGVENFQKIILKTFNTRKEAEDYENLLLTEEFCNSPNTYNIQGTGNFSDKKHGFRKDLWYDYFEDIRKKYLSGLNTNELASYFSCDRGTIRHIVKDVKRSNSESQQIRFKLHPTSGARDLDFDKEYLDELLKLYNIDKWSVNRIATYFNKSCSFIDRRLNENNITKRKRSENNEKPFKKRTNGL